MKVVTQSEASEQAAMPAALAMGFFDGVHIGHAAVIGAARELSVRENLRCAVFTFTQEQGLSHKGKQLINSEQKHKALKNLGVEICYEPPFESFSRLSPQEFFESMILRQYNAKAIFCGEDFQFGAGRSGNIKVLGELCKKHGVSLNIVSTAQYEGQVTSSTRIKRELCNGNIEQVNGMLGRPYEIYAAVNHGKQLGSKLGFPTINQRFDEGLCTPAYGVYITKTLVDDREWPSATGWGTRPSIQDGEVPSCETFIPGFDGELYGQKVCVQFYEKIADTCVFSSQEALANAVKGWAKAAVDFFE